MASRASADDACFDRRAQSPVSTWTMKEWQVGSAAHLRRQLNGVVFSRTSMMVMMSMSRSPLGTLLAKRAHPLSGPVGEAVGEWVGAAVGVGVGAAGGGANEVVGAAVGETGGSSARLVVRVAV